MPTLEISRVNEPRTVAELFTRYRDARKRLSFSPPQKAPSIPPIQTIQIQKPPKTELPAKLEDDQFLTSLPRNKATAALKMVSKRTNVSARDILGNCRFITIIPARQEAMWVVKTVTRWSLPRLGRFFNRDHTTVLHAIRRMEARGAEDPELRAYMDTIIAFTQLRTSP